MPNLAQILLTPDTARAIAAAVLDPAVPNAVTFLEEPNIFPNCFYNTHHLQQASPQKVSVN